MGAVYDALPDQGRKNPVTIQPRVKVDSRIISLRITAGKNPTNPGTKCLPDPKLLVRRPLRYSLKLTSGGGEKTPSGASAKQLKFHDDDDLNKKRRFYCAIWNPKLSDLGAWDTKGIKLVHSDGILATCYATKIGTVAVMSEIVEHPWVPDDYQWLVILKMIGYGVSILLLAIYCVTILFSKYLWEMFHILGMNIASSMAIGNILMICTEFEIIRSDRHVCAGFGAAISFFYLSSAGLVFVEAHAIFRSIAYGVIGGRTHTYLCIGWAVGFIGLGANIFLHLPEFGNDPRCMVGWTAEAKYPFFLPMIGLAGISTIIMAIVICNISSPQLRKKSFIEDQDSLAKGFTAFILLFTLTWSWTPLSYIKYEGMETPDLYPAFQVMNSWMGVFYFVLFGLGSKRFRVTMTGSIKARVNNE